MPLPPPTHTSTSVINSRHGPTATAARPFVNSLGMKFVPVPGTDVLFSVWEMRVKDYAAYAAERLGVDDSWKNPVFEGQPVCPTDDCPVVNVSWEDAVAFCEWLSRKEGVSYRLPTDAEWSVAVGLPTEPGVTPKEKDEKTLGYPWGSSWPPPQGCANYRDKSSVAFFRWDGIEGYDDGFVTTAPVGSFTPNQFGLYDIGGNVWEWCQDWYYFGQKEPFFRSFVMGYLGWKTSFRVLRGGAWYSLDKASLRSSFRYVAHPSTRNDGFGFRCVVSVR